MPLHGAETLEQKDLSGCWDKKITAFAPVVNNSKVFYY